MYGIGWGTSLEVGKRFSLGPNTSTTTRNRAVYTDVCFDSLTDENGVEVSQDDSASIVIGPAVTVEQMFPDNGISIFADANVSRNLLDESSVDASGFSFESGLDDTWSTLSFGGTMETGQGTSAYITAEASAPFGSGFGGSMGHGLRAGVRIDF